MSPTHRETILYGDQAQILSREEDHTHYRLPSPDGEVLLTAYPVFPGIEIIYNDVHAASCQLVRGRRPGLLEINHCREGRIEHQYGGRFCFLAPGDLSVSLRDACQGPASFPTGHYHGITVTVDPAHAPDCLSCLLEDVNVRPGLLAEKFCKESPYFAARSSAGVEHIFSQLYSVPEAVRKGYFKVKILELLLFLSVLPVSPSPVPRSYTAAQVRLAKEIGEYLLTHTEDRCTIAELAEHFNVTPSLLNSSFRGVYGMSPATFRRGQKMHGAAQLLRTTDRTVLDIAGQYGYDNASKFAKAFRDVIGVSPAAYRSVVERDSCAPF